MTRPASLESLIEAMAGAVVDAQGRIEDAQVAHIARFFDDDLRPRSVVVRVPSMQAGAPDGGEDLYRVPLLPLVPTTSLRIKDVEISFDADLGTLFSDTPAADEDDAANTGAGEPHAQGWRFGRRFRRKRVGVDTARRSRAGSSSSVHVKLRVEGVDPNEGAARLINHLAMTQGVFQTFGPDNAD